MSLEIGTGVPVWINAVLTTPSLWFIARVGLTAAYWVTGLQQLFGWTDAVAEMRSFALRARTSDYRGGDCREDWRRDSRDSGFFRMASGGGARRIHTASHEHIGLIAGLVLAAMVAALRLGL
jgi:hypothetical protein